MTSVPDIKLFAVIVNRMYLASAFMKSDFVDILLSPAALSQLKNFYPSKQMVFKGFLGEIDVMSVSPGHSTFHSFFWNLDLFHSSLKSDSCNVETE